MLRNHMLSGALLALLSGLLLLAGCASAGPTTQTAPTTTSLAETATPGFTGTATITTHGDWETYSDATFGFRLDFPAGVDVSIAYHSVGEVDLLWGYDSHSGPPPADLPAAADISGELFAATGMSNPSHMLRPDGPPYPCAVGTPITIGSGITAYQNETYTDPTPQPGDGAIPGPSIGVNLATGGVYLSLSLYGKTPRETFLARYGAIWQHILNSFVPGPAVPNAHPCG